MLSLAGQALALQQARGRILAERAGAVINVAVVAEVVVAAVGVAAAAVNKQQRAAVRPPMGPRSLE